MHEILHANQTVLLTETNSFTFHIAADSYIRHPNSYLPSHGYNIPSEPEGDCLQSPSADSDDVEPYGFPSNRNRRKHCDDDVGSVITTLGLCYLY